MDREELIARIKAANQSWTRDVLSELHDFQYDSEADILYVVWGKAKDSFSFALDFEDEDVYLRVEVDTYKIVGLDIPYFKESFLVRHEDARQVFEPFLQLFGDADWRIQIKKPSLREPGEITLFQPNPQRQLEYFPSYIPRVAPELVCA